MPPRNFCDIDSKYYLFGKSDTPEEKVRQWMIFELLAVYNVPVQAISIESPVKVGTRQYRADILLLKDYRPWAVIECKRQEDGDISNGIEQAVSYASCLQAEFAAFTNGKDWLVKRCRAYQWISVPDLPTYSSSNSSAVQLDQLSISYTSIALLMRWIHGFSSTLGEREFLLGSLNIFCNSSRLYVSNYRDTYSWLRLLRDIIAFFKDLELCHELAASGFSSFTQKDINHLVKIFTSLVKCHKKFDPSLELNREHLSTYIDDHGCGSIDELFEFYRCNLGWSIEAFECFFSYFDRWNRQEICKNSHNLESILIKLITQLVKHFHQEWIRGKKIAILNSNLGLTLSVIDLVKFIFENELQVTIPDTALTAITRYNNNIW
jgi:hypothetical protein